jgi:hypothetical protein
MPLADGGVQYVWTGDRWQTAPDHLLGHDPQTWFPLTFAENGDILPFTWVDTFAVDIDAAEEEECWMAPPWCPHSTSLCSLLPFNSPFSLQESFFPRPPDLLK